MSRADQTNYSLLQNGSATGAGVRIAGGEYTFNAEGTAGGATIGLQMQTSNGTWVGVNAVGALSAISSATLPYAATQIYLPPCMVRAAVTGGAPSGLYVSLCGVG